MSAKPNLDAFLQAKRDLAAARYNVPLGRTALQPEDLARSNTLLAP